MKMSSTKMLFWPLFRKHLWPHLWHKTPKGLERTVQVRAIITMNETKPLGPSTPQITKKMLRKGLSGPVTVWTWKIGLAPKNSIDCLTWEVEGYPVLKPIGPKTPVQLKCFYQNVLSWKVLKPFGLKTPASKY